MLKKFKDFLMRDDDDRVRIYLNELINHNSNNSIFRELNDPQKLTFSIIEFFKLHGARECTIEVYQVPIKRFYHVDLNDVNYDSTSEFCEVKTKNSDIFYISDKYSHNNIDSRSCRIDENMITLIMDSTHFQVKFIITLPYPIEDMLKIELE